MHFYKGKKCYPMWSFFKICIRKGFVVVLSQSPPYYSHGLYTTVNLFLALLFLANLFAVTCGCEVRKRNTEKRKTQETIFFQSVSFSWTVVRLCTFYFCGHFAFHVAADSNTQTSITNKCISLEILWQFYMSVLHWRKNLELFFPSKSRYVRLSNQDLLTC